jgi:hypothetical protein
MKLFGHTLEGFAKAIVILVAVFLVSTGLCGLSLGLGYNFMSSSNTPWNNFLGVMALCSGFAIVLSVAGIVLVLIIWLISAAVRNSSGKAKDNPQKLFDSDQNGDGKKPQ